jgi:16S rRNA (guanine527-N7)-methyltransferase
MDLRDYLELSEEQYKKFDFYETETLEWNRNVNLTAITEHNEFILKHFVDSLSIRDELEDNSKVLDLGTGAGFPGIPLKIYNSTLNITLMDSLNKRINFLNNVIEKLGLEKIEAVHGRAEEMGQNRQYREQYDIVVSRAVANLSTLIEYLAPFAKVGGKIIVMKGPSVDEEIKNATHALKELNCEIEDIKNFNLAGTDNERNVLIIRKIKETNKKYPRKAGTPSKMPL